MSNKKPTLVARFFFLLNNVLALVTWAAYLAWFINPSNMPLSGILALAVPFFIAINVLFIIFWLLFFRRYAWLSAITIALGWWHIGGLIGFSDGANQQDTINKIRVMSYNVRSFHYPGPYKWHGTPPGMTAMANTVQPDILCMQEYLPGGNWQPKFTHPHRFVGDKRFMTLAIYSNYPFIKTGMVPWTERAGEYDGFIYGDILHNQDTIRVINVHLVSIGINNKDFRTFTNIDKTNEEAIQKSGTTIYKQLMNAYRVRGGQVQTLFNFIADSPHPTLLCGDLNDTPTTYTYRKLTNSLDDTFQSGGKGLGTSHIRFHDYHLPLRIDHILASKQFSTTNWQRVKVEFSDHYPIYADLFFQKAQ